MRYKITFKRLGFFSKKQSVIVKGHNYDATTDKLVLFFPNGTIREVARWKDCEVFLGEDWVLATKKEMEKEAQGLNVPLETD